MHKGQFDDLIANARKKRAVPNEEVKKDDEKIEQGGPDTGSAFNSSEESQAPPRLHSEVSRPYEGNEQALATIREKVARANQGHAPPLLSHEPSSLSNGHTPLPTNRVSEPASEPPVGMMNPFTSPTRKMPMFSLPEDPVVDVEKSGVQ